MDDQLRTYEKPVLDELGQLRDVTGGWFDLGDLLDDLFGGGSGGGPGPRGSR